jgi:hypothetical protein
MRDEVLFRLRCEVDGLPTDGQSSGADRGAPLSTPNEPATPPSNRTGPYLRKGTLYAVEVCWISDGAVTCRTYRVRAVNESRAARIGCRRARKVLRRRRVTRIEAVDVEPIGRGDGHE